MVLHVVSGLRRNGVTVSEVWRSPQLASVCYAWRKDLRIPRTGGLSCSSLASYRHRNCNQNIDDSWLLRNNLKLERDSLSALRCYPVRILKFTSNRHFWNNFIQKKIRQVFSNFLVKLVFIVIAVPGLQ